MPEDAARMDVVDDLVPGGRQLVYRNVAATDGGEVAYMDVPAAVRETNCLSPGTGTVAIIGQLGPHKPSTTDQADPQSPR